MLPFPKFENNIDGDQSVLKNSLEIQQKKMVKQIHPISDNEWIATIQSQTLPEHSYQVLVRIKDGFVSYMTCNCPYDCGALCKHIGATLLEIKKKKLHTKPKKKQIVDLEDPEGIKVSFIDGDTDAPTQRLQKEIVRMTSYVPNKENHDVNLLDEELECNVCLSAVENPVLLPCQAHAMCFDCFSRLYARKTVQKGGYRYVVCPVCTDNGGKMTIRNLESIKVCKKLERILQAHETEKTKTTIKIDRMKRDQEKEKEVFDDFIKCYAGKTEEWIREKNSLEASLFELKGHNEAEKISTGVQVEIQKEKKSSVLQQLLPLDNSTEKSDQSPRIQVTKSSPLDCFNYPMFEAHRETNLLPGDNEDILEIRKSSILIEDISKEPKRPSKLEFEPKRKTSSIKSKLLEKEREKEKVRVEVLDEENFITSFSEIPKPQETIYSPKLAAEMFKSLIPDSIPSSQESAPAKAEILLEKRPNPYRESELSETSKVHENEIAEEKQMEKNSCGARSVKKVKTLANYIYKTTVPSLMKLFIATCVYALLFRLGIEFLFPAELIFTNIYL